MPNLSFDIFYSADIINVTASRSGAAPRVKPDWKVRQAPKLAPRSVPTPQSAFGRGRSSQGDPNREEELVEDEPKDKGSTAGSPSTTAKSSTARRAAGQTQDPQYPQGRQNAPKKPAAAPKVARSAAKSPVDIAGQTQGQPPKKQAPKLRQGTTANTAGSRPKRSST